MPVNLNVCMHFNIHVMHLICGFKGYQTKCIVVEFNKHLCRICLYCLERVFRFDSLYGDLNVVKAWRQRDPKTLGFDMHYALFFPARVPVLLVSFGHHRFQRTLQTVSQSRRFSGFIAYDLLRLCHLCCCELSSRFKITKDESVTSNVLEKSTIRRLFR